VSDQVAHRASPPIPLASRRQGYPDLPPARDGASKVAETLDEYGGNYRYNPTFGPQLRFQKVPSTANQPPSAGLQFFGHVTIDAATRALTVRHKDLEGATLLQVTLDPVRPG
jgi:phosphodiesterase/alkaline phosphatase D-like protein